MDNMPAPCIKCVKLSITQMPTLVAGGSYRDVAEKYKGVLDSLLQLGDEELGVGLKAFIEAVVNENVGSVILLYIFIVGNCGLR